MESVAALGTTTTPAVCAALAHPSLDVRTAAAMVIARVPLIAAVGSLRQALEQETDPRLVAMLVIALGEVGGARDVELLGPQHSAVTVLARTVSRLRGLIEDLLILNRLDSGKGRAVNEEVDLHRSTADIIQSLDPIAAKKSVELIGPDVSGDDMDAAADRQEATFRTMGDRSQLERALMNVVRNAVKFTPTHGHVTIALATQDSHVEFVCHDSGIGIPEKDMKSLSDRFFRASNAIEQQLPGSGLGLSIVRAIVEGHQGTMKIGSVEGEGTRVAITLPLAGASDGMAPSVLVE